MTYTNKLIIVIRDDTPLIHCNDSPSFRSIQIELTPDQMAKIVRRENEVISKCFIEQHED